MRETEAGAERQEAAPARRDATLAGAGAAVRDNVAAGVRGMGAVEGEVETLVRNTVGGAIRVVGTVATEGTMVTRDVAKGAISAVEDVGVTLVGSTRNLAKNFVGGVTDVGGDLGTTARQAARGTVDTVGELGGSVIHTVSDVLVDAAVGVKSILGAILPGRGTASVPWSLAPERGGTAREETPERIAS